MEIRLVEQKDGSMVKRREEGRSGAQNEEQKDGKEDGRVEGRTRTDRGEAKQVERQMEEQKEEGQMEAVAERTARWKGRKDKNCCWKDGRTERRMEGQQQKEGKLEIAN